MASIASTGFALSATALGAKRGWVSREDALSRAQATLYSVRTRWPNKNGWFYHFVNWQSGQRMWSSEVSSIDTAIFLMGAIVAERYFKDAALTTHLQAILDRVDWNWMLTNGGALPNSLTFCMGWTPENGFISARWNDYSELMGLYVLALGDEPAVPYLTWEAWTRRTVVYQGFQFFTGGPLFMHQMSHVFMNFKNRRDNFHYDYGKEAEQATRANRQYCINNPRGYAAYGPNFWGLSAGDTPDGYKALGAPGNIVDNGTIIPTSAICAVQDTPIESRATADFLRSNYAYAFGRYGFSNGINPTRNWVGNDVIGIDLGMMMLGIANERDGFAHNLEMSHPVVGKGFRRANLRPWPIKIGPAG